MYLKHNVKIVPYIWNWYAWSHLIAPHTAAMNIVGRHLEIMQSFVDCPEMHFEAINTRGMVGGPFINHLVEKQPEIKALLEKTKTICAELIKLAAQIKEFDTHLQQSAVGQSLETLYTQLPKSLKGLVEITYNLNNHPEIRFIEPLLYKKYYDPKAESLVLEEVKSDDRPFCLSTPHISSEEVLQISIPFSSKIIDQLTLMKQTPGNPNTFIDSLNLSGKQVALFQNLFTKTPLPQRDNHLKSKGIRIRYFGHACMLIQTKDISILIDPALGYDFDGKQQNRFTYLDLPDSIDYVLVTHNHQDHFLFEVLLQLRHKIKTIVVPSSHNGSLVDPSMKLALQYLGFSRIKVVDAFDEIDFNGSGKITMLPFLGEHGDLSIQSKLSYHIRIGSLTFLFLADSNNLDPQLYDHLFEYIGATDVVYIGMECVGAPTSWLYGPLLTKPLKREHDKSRRLSGSDCNKAMDIIQKSGCKEAYIYAMGMEPWLSYIMAVDYNPESYPIIESEKFVQCCRNKGIKSERLYGKHEWFFSREQYDESFTVKTVDMTYAL